MRVRSVALPCAGLLWLTLSTVAAQTDQLDRDLAEWKPWVARLGAAISSDGGESATAALAALQARVAAEGADAPVDRALYAALGALAWRCAVDAKAAARTGETPQALLELAVTATARGGDHDDIVVAHVLRAGQLDAEPRRQRRLLLEARDLTGRGHHGPFVLLARLDIAEGRFGPAAENLAAAEQRLAAQPAATWLRAEFHETRARLHVHLGLPDLVERDADAAAAAGLAPGRLAWLHFAYAMSIEDFAGALRLGDALLAEHRAIDRAEVLLFMARAHGRDFDPAEGKRPTPRALAEEALAAATQPTTRARANLELAMFDLVAGDPGAAARRLAAADAARAEIPSERAFDVAAEAAVARARLALATGDDARLPDLRTELERLRDELFARWRSMPLRVGGLGFLQFGERRDVLAALIAVERRLAPAQPERALQHLLDAQALGTLARRFAHEPGTAADVQRTLVPADGGILVFLPTVLGECSFVITRDAIEFHVLPRSDHLLRDLRAFRGAMLTSDAGPAAIADLQDRGRALLAQILPPRALAQLRTWRSCVVVGRELLGKLPFEALPGFDAPWLGVEKALWYLPSLPFGLERARGRAPLALPTVDCLLVAATRDAPGPDGQPVLAIRDAELAAVVDAWAQPRVLAGSQAERSAILSREAAPTDLLWILGHGHAVATTDDDERPLALAMADAFLRCADVDTWAGSAPASDRRVPPVVALSVCGGESGPPRRGDDTGGHLAGAFLAAGADAVLAADADLRIDGHLALLRALHAALHDGATLAEALRRARAALVAGGGEFSHPRHHAHFSIFGMGDVTVRAAPRTMSWWLVIAAALVGVAGLAGLLRSRRRRS